MALGLAAVVGLTLGALKLRAEAPAPRTSAAPAPATADARLAYAYLASGKVVSVSWRTGKVVAARAVAGAPSLRLPSSLLAWSPDRTVVYALTARRGRRPQRVVALRAGDLAVQKRLRLPRAVEFSSLVVGPRTGTVYLLGTRQGAPVLARADGGLARLAAPAALREGDDRRWLVIAATVDDAERRLVVSYHGESTTGADVIDLGAGPDGGPPACPFRLRAGLGCLRGVHGAAVFAGDALVATTGTPEVAVLHAGGNVAERLDSELPGNHLMAVARDPDTGAVLVAGSCLNAGGLAVLDVRRGGARVRGFPARATRRGYRGICGDSVAVRAGRAIVGALDITGRGELPGGLFLVDVAPGGARRFVRGPSPLAVLL